MGGLRWNSGTATALAALSVLLVPLVVWVVIRARTSFFAGEEKRITEVLTNAGVQELNYHATRDALTQEKFLYLARAGPYSTIQCPQVANLVPRLAENVEMLISQERTRWATLRQQLTPPEGQGR